MRIAEVWRVVLVAGAGLVIASTNADAAGGRTAARERCMAQSRASVDANLGAVHNQRRETAIYRSCMQQAGFRP